MAEVVYHFPERVYDLDSFRKADGSVPQQGAERSPIEVKVDPGRVVHLDSVSSLPETVSSKCREVIEAGLDPSNNGRWESRSEALFWTCCELVRSGCDDETIYSVITSPELRISDSVLDKGCRSHKYALRQISRARERTAQESIDFTVDDNGKPHGTVQNYRIGIRKFGVRLTYDEFSDRCLIHGLDGFGPHLDDRAVTRMWLLLESEFALKPGKEKFWATWP